MSANGNMVPRNPTPSGPSDMWPKTGLTTPYTTIKYLTGNSYAHLTLERSTSLYPIGNYTFGTKVSRLFIRKNSFLELTLSVI